MTEFEMCLKKGAIGEEIIMDYLEKKGYIVYTARNKKVAHLIDFFANKGKGQVIGIEVKTKPKFNYHNIEIQGINTKSYNEYIESSKVNNIAIFLFFVDPISGEVFTKDVRLLKNPIQLKQTICWDIKQMNYLFNIGQEKIQEIQELETLLKKNRT